MSRWLFLVLASSFVTSGFGQTNLFPRMEGDELKSTVREIFKPNFVQLYPKAIKALYTDIYNHNDTIITFYSRHRQHLPPAVEEPVVFLSQEGRADGVLFTHIYPITKGASKSNGNAYSDLHNLVPVNKVIKKRGDQYRFGETEPHPRSRWSNTGFSGQGQTQESRTQLKEAFHKVNKPWVFEPPKEVKGDVARSIFYFYTMYEEEANRADNSYFRMMQQDLCDWHHEDPVSQEEIHRNDKKAKYQEDKPNPFVIDCNLANRIYCQNASSKCSNHMVEERNFEEIKTTFRPVVQIIPNPTNKNYLLDISRITPGIYGIQIYNADGRLIMSVEESLDIYNSIQLWNTKTGLYYIHLLDEASGQQFSDSFEIVKQG